MKAIYLQIILKERKACVCIYNLSYDGLFLSMSDKSFFDLLFDRSIDLGLSAFFMILLWLLLQLIIFTQDLCATSELQFCIYKANI